MIYNTSKGCEKHWNVEFPSLVIMRNFDEKLLVYDGDIDSGYISLWVTKNQVPTLLKYSDEVESLIFEKRHNVIIYFEDEEWDKETKKKKRPVKKIKKYV